MASLHQGHHLPWDSVLRHLSYIGDKTDVWKHETHPFLFLAVGPTKPIHGSEWKTAFQDRISSDYRHFARVFAKRIKEFSVSEKQKIDDLANSGISQGDDENMFDFQWDAHPEFITHSRLFCSPGGGAEACMTHYSFWEGDPMFNLEAVDVIKHLVNIDTPESLTALRRLARDERVGVLRRRHLSWGHHFGWSRIAEHALLLYVTLNVLVDRNMHCRGIQWLRSLPGFASLEKYLTSVCDGCEHCVPDRVFFQTWKATKDDLDVLAAHLKLLFRRLYLYDWLSTEAGGETNWQAKILSALSMLGKNYSDE